MRRTHLTFTAAAAAFGLLAAGCPGREVAKVDPNQVKEQYHDIPVEVNRDIDILFVIDNSGSMAEEQASLATNFNRFVNVLENIEGGLPNIHLGVVSSDLGAGPYNISDCSGNGDNGALQNAPRDGSCSPPAGAFISDIANPDGSRTKNYTGTLADTFSCIARLGINGCGFEHHLESMRRGLNGSNPQNAGFLRDNAYLAVVIMADEDDCSAKNTQMFDTSQTGIDDPLGPLSSFRCTEFGVECDVPNMRQVGPRMECHSREDSPYMYDVQEYIDFLKGLKDDPSQIIVAGIVGPPTPFVVGADMAGKPTLEPSCALEGVGEAAPAVRIAQFLAGFPGRNTITTICSDDLSDALTLIANLLRKVIGSPCLEGDIADSDPGTAGIQPDCQVSDVRFPGQSNQSESVLPVCNNASDPQSSSNLPCYWIEPDTADCADTDSQLSITVYRSSGSVPTGTHVIARCLVN